MKNKTFTTSQMILRKVWQYSPFCIAILATLAIFDGSPVFANPPQCSEGQHHTATISSVSMSWTVVNESGVVDVTGERGNYCEYFPPEPPEPAMGFWIPSTIVRVWVQGHDTIGNLPGDSQTGSYPGQYNASIPLNVSSLPAGTYTVIIEACTDAWCSPQETRQFTITPPIDGDCGGAHNHTFAYNQSSYTATYNQCDEGNPSSTVFPAQGGFRNWTCSGTNGGSSSSTCTAFRDPAPVNGQCGGAHNHTFAYNQSSYTATYNQCDEGTPSTTAFPAQGSSRSWTCSGTNGGNPSGTCTAYRNAAPVNGQCGTAAMESDLTTPKIYSEDNYTISGTHCNSGTPSATPTSFPYPGPGNVTWTCQGVNGGSDVNCTAYKPYAGFDNNIVCSGNTTQYRYQVWGAPPNVTGVINYKTNSNTVQTTNITTNSSGYGSVLMGTCNQEKTTHAYIRWSNNSRTDGWDVQFCDRVAPTMTVTNSNWGNFGVSVEDLQWHGGFISTPSSTYLDAQYKNNSTNRWFISGAYSLTAPSTYGGDGIFSSPSTNNWTLNWTHTNAPVENDHVCNQSYTWTMKIDDHCRTNTIEHNFTYNPVGICSCASNPSCGTWSPNPASWISGPPQTFTMTGATDCLGNNLGTQNCNVNTHNGTCTVTVTDGWGNSRTCTSPPAKIDPCTPNLTGLDAGPSSTNRTALTNGGWFNRSDTGNDDMISFRWSLDASPSCNSNVTYYYELNSNSGNTITGNEDTTSSTWVDGRYINEGVSYFHVRARNEAGTWGAEEKFTIRYDKSAPTEPGTPSTSTPTSDTTPTFTWTDSDERPIGQNSGFPTWLYEICWKEGTSPNGSCSNGTLDDSTSNSWTRSSAWADGTYFVKVRAYDNVNNVSSWSNDGMVVINTTALSCSIAADTVVGPDPLNVNFTLSGNGGLGPYEFRYDYENDGWDTGYQTDNTKSHTYTPHGTYTMKVEVRDALSNTAQCTQVITSQDDTPVCTISADPGVSVSGDPVTLTWSSTNSTSGSIDNGVGVTNPVSGGSVVVNPTEDITYTMTVQNAGGDTATCSTSVDLQCDYSMTGSCTPVNPFPGDDVTCTMTIDPDSVTNCVGATIRYRYDWNNDGTFDWTNDSPLLTDSKTTQFATPGGKNILLRSRWDTINRTKLVDDVIVQSPSCYFEIDLEADPSSGDSPPGIDTNLTATITGGTNCTGTPVLEWQFESGDSWTLGSDEETHHYDASTTASVRASWDTLHDVTASVPITISEIGQPCEVQHDAGEVGYPPAISGTAPLTVNFWGSVSSTGECSSVNNNKWKYHTSWGWTDFGMLNTQHTYNTPGVYTPQFQGFNGTDTPINSPLSLPTIVVTDSCSVTITPSANPMSGQAPLPVDFDAVLNFSNCIGTPTYSWNYGDGNVDPGLNDPAISHTYQYPGSFTATLMVSIDGDTFPATVGPIVVGSNFPPTLSISVVPASRTGDTTTVFELTANANDADGDSIVYTYYSDYKNREILADSLLPVNGDGNLLDYNQDGVLDHLDTKAVYNIFWNVPEPLPPVEGNCPKNGSVCDLNEDGKLNEDDLRMYRRFLTRSAPFTKTMSFSYDTDGVYSAAVEVTDHYPSVENTEYNHRVRKEVALTVGTPCVLDGSSLDANPETGLAPLDVNFVANANPVGTGCADYNPLIYSWDFGDGTDPLVLGPTPDHTYHVQGTYTAEVTITLPHKGGNPKDNLVEILTTVIEVTEDPDNPLVFVKTDNENPPPPPASPYKDVPVRPFWTNDNMMAYVVCEKATATSPNCIPSSYQLKVFDDHPAVCPMYSGSFCGDGNPDPGEDCDLGDQNGVPGSGCTASCTFENTPWVDVSANPTDIPCMGSTTITWESENVDSCMYKLEGGSPLGGGGAGGAGGNKDKSGDGEEGGDEAKGSIPTSGSQTVSPPGDGVSTTITVLCEYGGGVGTVSDSVTVTEEACTEPVCGNNIKETPPEACDLGSLNGVPGSGCESDCTLETGPPAPLVNLEANPTHVVSGTWTTLLWDADNADYCSATWTSSTNTSGTEIKTPLINTEYCMTCTGIGGNNTQCVTVFVSDCVDTSWSPPASSVDCDVPFMQISNCGRQRLGRGTKDCGGPGGDCDTQPDVGCSCDFSQQYFGPGGEQLYCRGEDICAGTLYNIVFQCPGNASGHWYFNGHTTFTCTPGGFVEDSPSQCDAVNPCNIGEVEVGGECYPISTKGNTCTYGEGPWYNRFGNELYCRSINSCYFTGTLYEYFSCPSAIVGDGDWYYNGMNTLTCTGGTFVTDIPSKC